MTLAHYIVELDTDDPRAIRPEGIHATVSSWLDGNGHHSKRKPFSVTPAFRLSSGDIGFRVSVLTPQASQTLIQRSGLAPVRFGPRWFTPGEIALYRQTTTSWDSLYQQSDRSTWAFRLLTPTAFRSNDQYIYNPTPGLVFGHLRSVWNAFSTAGQLSLDLSEIDFVLGAGDVDVASIELRGRRVQGCIGPLAISARNLETGTLRTLNALAALAEFSGIGARTTYGLGVTRLAQGP